MRVRIPNEFLDQFNLRPSSPDTFVEMEFQPNQVVLFAVHERFGMECPIQVITYLMGKALLAEINLFAAANGLTAVQRARELQEC